LIYITLTVDQTMSTTRVMTPGGLETVSVTGAVGYPATSGMKSGVLTFELHASATPRNRTWPSAVYSHRYAQRDWPRQGFFHLTVNVHTPVSGTSSHVPCSRPLVAGPGFEPGTYGL
jgi:hypothetical protein